MRQRDSQELIQLAEKRGCRVEMSRKSHWKVYTPGGQMITLPGTPSDHRSLLNSRSLLRRVLRKEGIQL